ncbi:MAG TPA: hypothetical protein PKJ41_03190, partial [Bryobacteraceae bacterium]|nr:hypothetical protein [Bryobacteraceae bacterium]
SSARATLKIDDNGEGLPSPAPSSPGLGMIGMRARARHLGGELRLRSKPGQGLHIEVRIPVAEASA